MNFDVLAMANPGNWRCSPFYKLSSANTYDSTYDHWTPDKNVGRYEGNTGPIRRPRYHHDSSPYDDEWHRNPMHMRQGERNGPQPIHSNVAFLIKCGVLPKFVFQLSNKLLDEMNPDYCGICQVQLQDLIKSSKHYCSKDHFKKQKKFCEAAKALKQNSHDIECNDEQAYGERREVYCVLCDIKLTSKPHATSHYSGKAHKSIVFGITQPKNRAILNCDEDTVVKLRSWEMKFIKVDEEQSPQAVPPLKPNVVKNPPRYNPELYCNVCNTHVTTMEQMLQHRNGKRHLTKEKTIIFTTLNNGAIAAKGKSSNDATTGEEKSTSSAPEAIAENGKSFNDAMTGEEKSTSSAPDN